MKYKDITQDLLSDYISKTYNYDTKYVWCDGYLFIKKLDDGYYLGYYDKNNLNIYDLTTEIDDWEIQADELVFDDYDKILKNLYELGFGENTLEKLSYDLDDNAIEIFKKRFNHE